MSLDFYEKLKHKILIKITTKKKGKIPKLENTYEQNHF